MRSCFCDKVVGKGHPRPFPLWTCLLSIATDATIPAPGWNTTHALGSAATRPCKQRNPHILDVGKFFFFHTSKTCEAPVVEGPSSLRSRQIPWVAGSTMPELSEEPAVALVENTTRLNATPVDERLLSVPRAFADGSEWSPRQTRTLDCEFVPGCQKNTDSPGDR